jgi:hypothetical protein
MASAETILEPRMDWVKWSREHERIHNELVTAQRRIADLEARNLASAQRELDLNYLLHSERSKAHSTGYQKAIQDATTICYDKVPYELKTGKVDHNEMAWSQSCAIDILKLVKDPT